MAKNKAIAPKVTGFGLSGEYKLMLDLVLKTAKQFGGEISKTKDYGFSLRSTGDGVRVWQQDSTRKDHLVFNYQSRENRLLAAEKGPWLEKMKQLLSA